MLEGLKRGRTRPSWNRSSIYGRILRILINMAGGKKRVRFGSNPVTHKKVVPKFEQKDEIIRFSFTAFDSTRKWNSTKKEIFWNLANKLKAYEQMTWGQLAGNKGKNHPIDLDKLPKKSYKALEKLNFDDYDQIWSLSLSSKERIWGFAYSSKSNHQYFLILWWDPEQKVYPVSKKHT